MRTKKERLQYCMDWQGKLDDQYAGLKSKRAEALQFRDADPNIVAVIENRSKVTTTDMQDAIDMAKPDILEIIAGVDEPLKLDPNEAKYVEPVKKLQVLGNVMIKRKNRWFRICSDFLDDSMVFQFGAIKYRWIEDKKVTEKVFDNLTDEELMAMLENNADAAVSEDTIDENGSRITKIAYTTVDEYVRYDGVPSERIKFPLDIRDFAEAPIVIEEIRLYEHDFIKEYGQENFNKVKKIVEVLLTEDPDTEFARRFEHVGGLSHVYNKKDGRYKAYECYFWEGEVPWVFTYCGDVVLQDEENKYGKPPYRGGSPFLIAHTIMGKGYLDILREIQRERTYIRRQMTDILSNSGGRRFFVNLTESGMNIDDYENNTAMNALVRCTGRVGADTIMEEPKPTLTTDILAYWEVLSTEKDTHIPTPRAYTGVEGGADERTYRGKQLKVSQASKKLLMMIRGYMEEVFGPLFQDTLDCIAKFMKRSTVVRYLNEDYEIAPDDIVCEYALVVNVGLGSHDKQDTIVKLQQLIGLALQQVPLGIYTPANLFYINQELVKTMGFLNTSDFVTDPQLKESVMSLVQTFISMLDVLGNEPKYSQVAQEMAPQAMELVAKVLMSIGANADDIAKMTNSGGANYQGTQPGQETPAIQEQPAQPFNPQTTITGGGYWA